MSDKFDYYDLFSAVIPGILLVCWIPVCFPQIAGMASPKYPDAFAAIALVAVAVFVGQIILALSSMVMEQLLFWDAGGRPSDSVFTKGLHNFPLDSATRIRQKLADEYGGGSTDRSLFLCAMQLSESAKNSKVPKFNGLYAYHRSLAMLVILCLLAFLASLWKGTASAWDWSSVLLAIAGQVAILVIIVQRTRQRSEYYVREVLLTAERVLDERVKGSVEEK